jgi:hypothetical protein
MAGHTLHRLKISSHRPEVVLARRNTRKYIPAFASGSARFRQAPDRSFPAGLPDCGNCIRTRPIGVRATGKVRFANFRDDSVEPNCLQHSKPILRFPSRLIFRARAQLSGRVFGSDIALRHAQHLKAHHEFSYRGRAKQRRIEVGVEMPLGMV